MVFSRQLHESLRNMIPVYDYEADQQQNCFAVRSFVLDNVRSRFKRDSIAQFAQRTVFFSIWSQFAYHFNASIPFY